MSYVHDHIREWSNMSFAKNPYDDRKLPQCILTDERIIKVNEHIKDKSRKKFLCYYKQDGNITTKIINNRDKTKDYEKDNLISFSKIFHDLLEQNKLCPSNYLLRVVIDLYKWEKEHGIFHDQDYYIGMVARSCRTFASFIREQYLVETIDEIMSVEAKNRGKKYKMYKTTAQEDLKNKTDIKFVYDGKVYRVWSYQTSKSGVKCTSARVAKACGEGYNIMVPFNKGEEVPEFGWWLYDRERVYNILKRFVFDRDFKPISVNEYQKIVQICPEVIKLPAIFKV